MEEQRNRGEGILLIGATVEEEEEEEDGRLRDDGRGSKKQGEGGD